MKLLANPVVLIALGLGAAFFLPRNAARTEAAGYAE